jgi:ubiquitin carboxyl-terminal hydrolase 4/11/15
LSRVIARGSEALANSKVTPEGEIGPVDNSDIINRHITDADGNLFIELKHGMGLESFDLFPAEAWDLVVAWYGLKQGQYPIDRYAHNTNADKTGIPNIIYEFHPPIFTIHRLWSDHSALLPQTLKEQNPVAPVFVVSRSEPYMAFLKRIKIKAGIDLSRRVRVWRVPRTQPAAEPEPVVQVTDLSTPPSSRPGSPGPGTTVAPTSEPQDSWSRMLLDVATFSLLQKGEQRELIDTKDQTANPNYNGRSDLDFTGLGENQALVLDEMVDSTSYVLNYVATKGKGAAPVRGSGAASYPNSQVNSGRSSPAPGYNLRGRSNRSGRTLGTVGLSNLGNTCYMNSALQCVRSVEELTKYFLTGHATEELNVDNPLGNNGDVALAYDSLLKEIYKESVPPSVTPRQFKNTIGRYAPSFSGYGQQDSQEFLGFLLDGLQEDLSRVKKKPYIEKPDSTDEMVHNPSAIREMADKVWDITKKRDDSVIADLFTGMYKSTLVCPICNKVSITFDPFNNLTLQLPVENAWEHDVTFFPLNDKPIVINVDIGKQASISAMKDFVSKRVGVPTERLLVAEEFKSKFYKVIEDYKCASEEIGKNDITFMYELEAKPTNFPPHHMATKKAKFKLSYNDSDDEDDSPSWGTPAAENMVVPVFYRHPNLDRRGKHWTITGPPHFIMLTPEEVR